MEETTRLVDLYDIERRPGAGVHLWGSAVALQYDRVVDVNYRHRRANEPDAPEAHKDPEAEKQLHADVYFLALAVRRVLLFHDAVAAKIDDARLNEAKARFLRTADNAKDFRDYFEHLDAYLLGSGNQQKDGRIVGRVAPVLHLVWDADNVVVRFGERSMDITIAAKAAITLADDTAKVWDEHMAAARPVRPDPPVPDDGILRMLEVTIGVSTHIGADDDPTQVTTGTLMGTRVREATPEEVAARESETTAASRPRSLGRPEPKRPPASP